MILLLETSTLNCSVALGQPDGTHIKTREVSDGQYLHAEKLHVIIDELLREEGAQPRDLSAVAVGKGPGSFTGLRIGLSNWTAFIPTTFYTLHRTGVSFF